MSTSHPHSDIRSSLKESPLHAHVLPVGAWVSPPPANSFHNNPNYITARNYQLAKEAGITTLYGLYENIECRKEDVLRAMDCAQASGIGYLAVSTSVAAGKREEEILNQLSCSLSEHPAHQGTLVYDEPSVAQFGLLSALSKKQAEIAPEKLFYVNLLPLCAKSTQLQIHKSDESGPSSTIEEYRSYIRQYIQMMNPAILSFDNYPCEGATPHMAAHYFVNLSLIREATLPFNMPFWCFIQTCAWNDHVRVPDREEILWQVNTSLAYGAKGIQYFTFWQPLTDGEWRGGMMDADGTILPQYAYVKEANQRIQLCEDLFMSSHSDGVMVHLESPAPIPQEDILPAHPPLESITGNVPALVGCFTRESLSGYYVVNNTLTQSGQICLHFQHTVCGELRTQGKKQPFSGDQLSFYLGAGDGAYVQLL